MWSPRFYSFHHFWDLKQTFKIFLVSFSHFTKEDAKPRNAQGCFQAMEEVSGGTRARTRLSRLSEQSSIWVTPCSAHRCPCVNFDLSLSCKKKTWERGFINTYYTLDKLTAIFLAAAWQLPPTSGQGWAGLGLLPLGGTVGTVKAWSLGAPGGRMLPNVLSAGRASLPQHLLSGAELPLSPKPMERGKSEQREGTRCGGWGGDNLASVWRASSDKEDGEKDRVEQAALCGGNRDDDGPVMKTSWDAPRARPAWCQLSCSVSRNPMLSVNLYDLF